MSYSTDIRDQLQEILKAAGMDVSHRAESPDQSSWEIWYNKFDQDELASWIVGKPSGEFTVFGYNGLVLETTSIGHACLAAAAEAARTYEDPDNDFPPSPGERATEDDDATD